MEELREKLYVSVEKYRDLTNEKVLQVSQELDKLIVEEMKDSVKML
ncbi:aspartyl-phosphate phosphatase Spo0E family protein [Clostridium sp. KNHs214]|nr:aspartyl-phosphate phosphatase Spo0E family protein [Clostridium sp. KNHs214]